MIHYDIGLGSHLWDTALRAKPTSRGRLLEDLAKYLFRTSGEYEVRSRLRTLDAETDLLVRALVPTQPPHLDLGGYILVECKNTKARTNAAAVKKFATNVRLAGCRSGVLITPEGLTGAGKQGSVAHAEYTVRRLYHSDGTILIVLDKAAIEAIVHQRTTLVRSLRDGYEAIRFDYVR